MHRDTDLGRARDILKTEGRAILDLADRLGEPFAKAVDLVIDATGEKKKGRVVVTGMGKAGIIGQKISATLASTGTPSWSIHPAEAPHGDLGRITPDDVVLALSKSGETAEISRLLGHVKRFGARVISITCRGSRRSGATATSASTSETRRRHARWAWRRRRRRL